MKNNDINYDELCNLIANEVGGNVSINTVHKYLNAIYKVILKQLQINDRINFYRFGCFEIRERKSGERLIHNPKNDENQIVYVKPRLSISFKPSSIFTHSVNNNFVLVRENTIKNLQRKKRNKKNKRIDNIAELLTVANTRKGVN